MAEGTVTFNSRYTRNMGNFESLQIEVGITDTPRSDETFTAAYHRVKAFVEDKLIDAVEEVEQDIKAAQKGN